ncbi:molecular chaperone Tir [Serratia marcescens]|uniref:Molecular chaperone Tir n=1 Tax=Serratia marcescens TaxID=615 RepID=A0A5C7BCH1_SERMA|nr:TIR domain-containing protein [Serratia marcescens]TXE21691.1 molecular chaperone Tir [Serratia marcescens]TXE57166.1 molecular chaperone Tir [Serratia marcescens]
MSYRNKTYVAFASEDISYYRLMEAWKANENIDFNFFDAHDLFVSRDTSKPETIKKNLRERMKNAKQIVLLGSSTAKKKGGDGDSFLAHEIDLILEFNLPVVIVNLDGGRTVNNDFIPKPLLDANHFTMSVSFQPKIIKHALDNYCATYSTSANKGPYYYKASVYSDLGI